MRTLVAAGLASAVIAAAVTAWFGTPPVRGDTLPATLYVSGLHIDSTKSGGIVEIANRSSSPADFYAVEVLFFHADGNRAADPFDFPLPLQGGDSVTVDVGAIVGAYRSSREIAPFKGPVQLVITALTCADLGVCPPGQTPRAFGPDVIAVACTQAEGKAIYDAAVQWRTEQ